MYKYTSSLPVTPRMSVMVRLDESSVKRRQQTYLIYLSCESEFMKVREAPLLLPHHMLIGWIDKFLSSKFKLPTEQKMKTFHQLTLRSPYGNGESFVLNQQQACVGVLYSYLNEGLFSVSLISPTLGKKFQNLWRW